MNSKGIAYDLERLREALRGGTRQRFSCVQVVESCSSTNDIGRELARDGAADGTVVVAGSQTAGRGRLHRQWHSVPERGVYMSLILRPRLPVASWGLIPLSAGLAVAKALEELGTPDVDVKWPNDVRCQGRKIAGILCEQVAGSPRAVIVGLGINVGHLLGEFPPELRDIATSLRLATGRKIAREDVVAGVLKNTVRLLEGWEGGGSFPWEDWRRLSAVEGRRVRIDGPAGVFEAVAEAVESDGALRVRTEDGESSRVLAGDVSLRT